MTKGRLRKAVEEFSVQTAVVPSDDASVSTPATWYEHESVVLRLMTGTKEGDTRDKYSTVFPALMRGREFVRVATSNTSTDSSAYDIYERSFTSLTFRQVSMVELKYELLIASNQLLSDKTQDSLLDTFFSTIPILKHRDRRYIGVSNKLYWDTVTRTLQSTTHDNRCFIRLFDTPKSKAVGGIQHFPDGTFNGERSKSIVEQYNELLSKLRALPENATFSDIASLPIAPNLHFILEWADGDQGVYWDILTMFSTGFMDKKPVGAYCLVGLTRNGKSSCANLGHTLFGRNNTAMVCCSELGDYHKSASLRDCIMNIPDDEDDDINKYQKEFKQLAAHQTLVVSKMRSQEPFEIPASQFTMIFPMNTDPTWKGTSASACSKRTLIIPFRRDFSKSDKAIGNFEELAFTADNLCTLAAHCMAIASFLKERPQCYGFSDASKAQQLANAADNNSVVLYRDAFHKYFDGFSRWELLYDDYVYWCQENEYRYCKKSDMRLAFEEYKPEARRANWIYKTQHGNESKKARRVVVGTKKYLLMPDAWFDEIRMDVETVHKNGDSVVTVLDRIIEERAKWMKGANNGGD